MSFTSWEALERFSKNSPVLATLDAEGRERLAAKARPQEFAPGQAIVEQGAAGDSFYLITGGEVMVLVAEAGEVARLGPGKFFGEMGMLTQQPRSATVVATEPVMALCFARNDVLGILRDYPAVHEMIAKTGLQRTEDNIERAIEGTDDDDFGLAELLEGGDERPGLEPSGSPDQQSVGRPPGRNSEA